MRRLTLTGGVRFDYFNIPRSVRGRVALGRRAFVSGSARRPELERHQPAGGRCHDLFGNGKTAIKASVSRYVTGQVYAFSQNINPLGQSVNSVTRTWSDGANGNPKDFIPQGDPLNPLPNGEFTGTINPLFGSPVVTTHYDPS